MRSTISSTAAQDVSRLCAQCRRASFLAGPKRSRAVIPPSSAKPPLRSPSIAPPCPPSPLCFLSHTLSSSSAAGRLRSQVAQDSSSLHSPPQTLYDVFPKTLPSGPPPAGRFPVDARALRREFLQLQARAHPDMHPAPLKARAEASSAHINEAYRTLSNPLLRAQYLLSLRGVDVAADETLKIEDPALLTLVLDAHEEITDARAEEHLRPTRELNDERIRQSEGVLERAFREDDVEAAKREAVRLRYWVNIRESLHNWEEGRPVALEH